MLPTSRTSPLRRLALLALLVLHANRVVPADRLVDELWGGAPPATSAKSLQVHISRVRRAIGEDRVVTRSPGYLLRAGDDEIDAARFERLLNDANAADPARAALLLREALALWRGPPLADLAHEGFAQAEIR